MRGALLSEKGGDFGPSAFAKTLRREKSVAGIAMHLAGAIAPETGAIFRILPGRVLAVIQQGSNLALVSCGAAMSRRKFRWEIESEPEGSRIPLQTAEIWLCPCEWIQFAQGSHAR